MYLREREHIRRERVRGSGRERKREGEREIACERETEKKRGRKRDTRQRSDSEGDFSRELRSWQWKDYKDRADQYWTLTSLVQLPAWDTGLQPEQQPNPPVL